MGVDGPLSKVTRGQPFAMPAAAYNAFVDAAEAHRRAGSSGSPGSGAAAPASVWLRNDSAEDRGRFEVLGVDAAPILPSLNLTEFQRWPVLGGVAPTLAHAGLAAVLLEPIRAGRVGRAMVAGVTACRVRMIDDRDRCADIDETSPQTLRSGLDGPARLLWVQPPPDREEPDTAWTIALLGPGGARLMRAVITGSSSLSTNRWQYEWAEARWDGSKWSGVAGGYSHASWGYAFNGVESGNTGSGVQGSGIDVGNLPATFAHKPVGPGAAVWLRGPELGPDGTPAWTFDFANNVDGSCP